MTILPLLLIFSPPANDAAHRDALTHYGMARWQTRNGQLVAAALELEKSRRAEPQAGAPTRDLIRIYADLGRDAAALRLGEDLIERQLADANTLRVLARVHSAGQRHDRAAQLLAQAVLASDARQPTQRLALLKELARAGDRAKDADLAANAWQAVTKFIDDNFNALKAESYDSLELHRERAVAIEQQARAYCDGKKYDEAIKAMKIAEEMFNDPRRANDRNAIVRLQNQYCEIYHRAGQLNLALQSLEQYLRFQPQGVAPYEKLALLLRQSQRGADVVPMLNQIIARSPSLAAPQWVLAAERLANEAPAARAQFERLMNSTTDPQFFRLMVDAFAKHQQPRELLALGDALFPARPEGPRQPGADVSPEQSDQQQAFAKALNNKPEFALAVVRASADGKTRSAEHWELLGWLAERVDAPAEIERALNAAIMANPRDPSGTAFERLALHYSRHRQWGPLIDVCDRMRGFEVWRGLLKSDALMELDRRDEAFAEIRKNAGFATFSVQRQTARLHGMVGEYDEMLNVLNGMLKDYTTNDEVRRVRTMRAEAYLALNRIDDMEMDLRGLLEDDPDDILVLNNLGYYLAEKNRKLPEAEKYIRRAVEIDRHNRAKAGEAVPVSGVYLDSLGWVLLRRGQLAEAREQLQAAVNLPDARTDAVVWDHLGDVCFRLNDKAAAKSAWNRAAALFANDHRGRLHGRGKEVQRKLVLP